MSSERRAVRLAVGLWLALGFVVWNVIFDYQIRTAATVYLVRQGLHDAGLGPSVSIDGIMRPAASRGLFVATVWSAAIVTAGLSAVRYGARHAAGPGRSNGQTRAS